MIAALGLARCPHCFSRLGGKAAGAECPACGRPLRDAQGRALRPIDVALPQVQSREAEAFRGLILWGTCIAFCVLLLGPLLHVPLFLLAGPLLAAVHLVALRLTILKDVRRLLSGPRRTVFRWGTRLGVVGTGSVAYTASAIPLLGAALGAAVFAGLTSLVHAWARQALAAERDRRELTLWEKLLFALFVLLFLTGLTLLVALGFLARWGLELLRSLPPGPGTG